MKLFTKTALVFTAFTAILILFITGFVFESLRNDYENLLLDEASQTVHQKANVLRDFIGDSKQKTILLSVIPEMSGLQPETPDLYNSLNVEEQKKIEYRFSTIIASEPYISNLRMLDLTGQELFRFENVDGVPTKIAPEDLQDKSLGTNFVSLSSLNSLYVSDLNLNEEYGVVQTPHEPTIRVGAPVKNLENEIISYLIINYDPTRSLDAISSSNMGHTVLFDHDGTFLLHPDKTYEFGPQLQTGYNYFIEEPELAQNVMLMDSKKHVDSEKGEFRIWEKIFLNDEKSRYLVVTSVIPQSVLFSHLGHLQYELAIVAVFVVLGSIGITILITRHITSPLKSLLFGVKKIEKGQLVELKKFHDDEIGEIVDSFNLMSQSLDQSKILVEEYEKTLEEKLNELTTLTKAVDKSIMVSKMDLNGKIIFVNELLCTKTEFESDELLGKPNKIINFESDYPTAWRDIHKGKTWSGETKIKTKSEQALWTVTTVVPRMDKENISEFVILQVDITEKKHNVLLLQDALEELKELDTAKMEFSAMVSHELKTPLTPIMTYCDILKESKSDPSELEKECIDEIVSNANILDHLISDILDMHKLEMNKISFNHEPFKVEPLLMEVTKSLLPVANKKDVQLLVAPTVDISLNSDRFRISQILSNLIRNSIDFVNEHTGKIEVGAKLIDNYVEFYVKDNGIGISSDKLSKLFTKFYQVDSSVTRSHGGNGLGLVICKGLVEGLGGTIKASSQVNQGSTFSFTVPFQNKTLVSVKND